MHKPHSTSEINGAERSSRGKAMSGSLASPGHRGTRAVGHWVCHRALCSGTGLGRGRELGCPVPCKLPRASRAQPRSMAGLWGRGGSSPSLVFGSHTLGILLSLGQSIQGTLSPGCTFLPFLLPQKIMKYFCLRSPRWFSCLPGDSTGLHSSSRVRPERVTLFVLSAASVVTGAASPNTKKVKSVTPHL